MSLRSTLAMSLLSLAFTAVALPAQAQKAPPTPEQIEAKCNAHPDHCDAIKAKAETAKGKCAADADCAAKSAAAKTKAHDLKDKCAGNPAACEQAKAQAKQQKAALKSECASDPATCEQKKAELKAKLKAERAEHKTPG
jgi:hypothetical protein